EDPGRLYLWWHLGCVREALGDRAGAEAAWSRGVELARHEERPHVFALLVHPKLALSRLDAGLTADDLVADLRAWFPDDPLTSWVVAHDAMASGRWVDAVAPLERLWDIDAAALVHPVLAYDERMFGEYAAHHLGSCWFHLGDDRRAATWFGEAARLAPDVAE